MYAAAGATPMQNFGVRQFCLVLVFLGRQGGYALALVASTTTLLPLIIVVLV